VARAVPSTVHHARRPSRVALPATALEVRRRRCGLIHPLTDVPARPSEAVREAIKREAIKREAIKREAIKREAIKREAIREAI